MSEEHDTSGSNTYFNVNTYGVPSRTLALHQFQQPPPPQQQQTYSLMQNARINNNHNHETNQIQQLQHHQFPIMNQTTMEAILYDGIENNSNKQDQNSISYFELSNVNAPSN